MNFSCLVFLLLVAYAGTTSAATTAATTQAQMSTTAPMSSATVAPTGTTAPMSSTTVAPTGTTATPSTKMVTTEVLTGSTKAVGTTHGRTMATATTAPAKTDMTTVVMNSTTPAGNSTENTTVTTEAVTTVTPEPSPRFVVNNSDGEPCMLLNFDATMKVKYETTDGGWLESTLPMTNTSSFEGSCANNSLRSFTLYYPSEDTFCAILILFFNVTSNTTYYNRNGISVRYIEPCVQQNAKKFNTIDSGYFPYHSYDGTIGKSFECDSILNKAKYFNVTLDNILIQPFAQKSQDKGHFGEVETCKEPVLTTKNPIVTSPHPTAKPSPNKAGMIAGIVIGVLVAVAIVIGIAVYVVRKRRMAKNVSYGNL